MVDWPDFGASLDPGPGAWSLEPGARSLDNQYHGDTSRSVNFVGLRIRCGGGVALRETALGPRTPSSDQHPPQAQVDLTGLWRPLARNEDGSGMDGDYAGLPLNAAGRWRAQARARELRGPRVGVPAARMGLLSGSGRFPAPFVGGRRHPTQDVIAFHGRLSMREQEATIWMDGRPRPPDYSLHTWSGFSTGEWDGTTLVQTATHLKKRTYAAGGRCGAIRRRSASAGNASATSCDRPSSSTIPSTWTLPTSGRRCSG